MKTIHFLPGLALLAACYLLLPSMASATDYYVHANKGSNTNSGAGPNAAFGDLAYAMKKLKPGDTLHIRGGTYTNVPSINLQSFKSGTKAAPIVVKRYLDEKPILSADRIVTILDVSWWIFEGLTFERYREIRLGKRDFATSTCINTASNITFRNNKFQHSNEHAIVINCAGQVEISNNIFDNLRSRVAGGRDVFGVITTTLAHDILITGNKFTDIGGDGLQLEGVDLRRIQVTDNEFKVVHPYRYRDEFGKPDLIEPQRFKTVGENAIDIKGGPGPIYIRRNIMHGFRPTIPGVSDASGDPGNAMILHKGSRLTYIEKNHFYNNVIDLNISGKGIEGQGNKTEIAYNVFENSVKADAAVYGTNTQQPRGLYLGNTSNVRVYNNVFHNADPTGKTLLWVVNLSNALLQNNVFHNGRVFADPQSSVLDISADYNAWSGITGKTNSKFLGLRDVSASDLKIDWSNWKPLAGSPLIDAGMPLQNSVPTDFYGAATTGAGTDIGVAEYNGLTQTTRAAFSNPPGC